MKKSRAHQKKISGIVVSGHGRGKQLGFPTANICSHEKKSIDDGVYACWTTVREKRYRAAVSVGVNEMFGATTPTIEAHLLDFSDDILGEHVEIECIRRLREMKRFDTVEALVEQMKRDIEEVKNLCLQE